MKRHLPCPVCDASGYEPWGEEGGWSVVRCTHCRCAYVNPGPAPGEVSEASRTGLHQTENGVINTTGRFWQSNVRNFQDRLASLMTAQELARPDTRWLDIGTGFGEMMIALRNLLPSDAFIEGIEPCGAKRKVAAGKGLRVSEVSLSRLPARSYDFVSIMNVLSHVPKPREFLRDIGRLLKPGSQLVLLTGNGADVERRDYPGALYLPDHLVFFGESSLSRVLESSGYSVLAWHCIENFFTEPAWVRMTKNTARVLLGRPRLPVNHGPFRSLLVKAALTQN